MIWAATRGGTSRFDGKTWTRSALPLELHTYITRGIGLLQSRDEALWINNNFGQYDWYGRVQPGITGVEEPDLRTVRYLPDADAPDTEITLFLDRVSQPGNTTLAWKGVDPWRSTPDAEVEYAWRLDEGEWSAFSSETLKTFLALHSGEHTFEVKARDRD